MRAKTYTGWSSWLRDGLMSRRKMGLDWPAQLIHETRRWAGAQAKALCHEIKEVEQRTPVLTTKTKQEGERNTGTGDLMGPWRAQRANPRKWGTSSRTPQARVTKMNPCVDPSRSQNEHT
jgi:hypothetical protein